MKYKRGYAVTCNNRRCQHYRSAGARKTLKHHPSRYWGANRKHAICPGCGREYSVDQYRSSGREDTRNRCTCNGYPFIHRRGSLFCDHGRAAKAGFSYYDRNTQEFAQWREGGMRT